MNKEVYARLSIAIILFVLSSFMPNLWAFSFIAIPASYSLVSGLIQMRNK